MESFQADFVIAQWEGSMRTRLEIEDSKRGVLRGWLRHQCERCDAVEGRHVEVRLAQVVAYVRSADASYAATHTCDSALRWSK